MVALEQEQVDVARRASRRSICSATASEVLRVPAPDLVRLAARFEALEGVGADRLQHREARLAVGLFLLAEHVVVDERRRGRSRRPSPPQTASAAGSVQPPCEDGEAREERLLVGAEQVVAPVDRRAERLLARGQVAWAAGEEVEALLEPGEQRLRREQLRAGGGELDREREAVEADADLGDRGRVRVRHGEVGLDGAGAFDEERDRLVLRERRDRGQVRGVGQVERRHRVLVLAREVERGCGW